jgi:hypothetical protein
LWTGEHNFPQIPILSFIPLPEQWLTQSILALLALSALGSLIFSKTRILVFMVVALSFWLALLDQHRWQPWFFQYFTLLCVLIPAARWYKKYLKGEPLLLGVQLCIALVYFYSGMFKVNPGFEEYIVVNTSNPLTMFLWGYKEYVYVAAGLLPWVEMILGISLFVPYVRNWAVMGITGLHLLILYLLGPWGHNINSVVWPWNIILIALVWVAFFKAKNFNYWYQILRIPNWQKVFLTIVTLGPILNWWGLYNQGLSYELYSGRRFVSHFKFHENQVRTIPSFLNEHTVKYGDTIYVRTYDWAIHEFNAPPNGDEISMDKTRQKTEDLISGK